MFRSNAEFVALKDELLHVKNYLRIQELRFPGNLTTEFVVPEFLSGTPVPPLIIHTFVENTIKHSVTLDEPIHLSIEIDVIENEEKSGIRISIKDTGKGFTEDILHKLQTGEKIVDEQGEHIGIRNAQKRLMLLYDGIADFSCRNEKNGGAVIEMILPFSNIQE
jgi:two-component system sensor histidine kinase YesM